MLQWSKDVTKSEEMENICVFMYLCVYSVAEVNAKWLPITKHPQTEMVMTHKGKTLANAHHQGQKEKESGSSR